MRYLSGKDIRALSAPTRLVVALEQALRDHDAGKVSVPTRGHVDFGGDTLLTMPVIGHDTYGAKIVSVTPSNAERQLPVINGLMTLHDRLTGAPLVVMDAAALTAQRTGAIGALCLKYSTPADLDALGIVGTGVQATWQAIYACAVRPIHSLYYAARSDLKTKEFHEGLSRELPGIRLIRCAHVDELLGRCPAVVAATSSSTPVLPDDRNRLEGKHYVSVGSFKPSMQELPDAVYSLAGEVVVDSDAARYEVGDLINPIARGLIPVGNVAHLADLVTGRRKLDISRTTVVKSVGNALYDLYAAQALFIEAQRQNRGTKFEA